MMCLVILPSITLTSGCAWFTNWVKIEALKPVIILPNRPMLEPITEADLQGIKTDSKQKLLKRDAQLKSSIEQHRELILRYSHWANKSNIDNGYVDPTVFIEVRKEDEE